MRGDLHAAIGFHPLSPVLSPLIAIAVVLASYRYVDRGEAWNPGRRSTVLIVLAATAMTVIWIARFWGALGGPVQV